MGDAKPLSISKLIAVPAVITLAVTILRLVGELAHWPAPFFSTKAGGAGAIVGISWLPIFFGPYFALKLAGAGDGPSGAGKAIGVSAASLGVLIAGAFLLGATIRRPGLLSLVALLLMLGAAFIPGMAWRSLGNTLIAYAFAARIPVLIVMYLAMAGNGGAGWGTHYDATPPGLEHAPLARKFIMAAILPQMTLWIGWTVAVGALFGTIAQALVHRKKPAAAAA